jgi:hypothetical protein
LGSGKDVGDRGFDIPRQRKRGTEATNHQPKRKKALTTMETIQKPCWTLKYCPYGPLVEQFPLLEQANDQSCKFFGHQCPVFFVAEKINEQDWADEDPN